MKKSKLVYLVAAISVVALIVYIGRAMSSSNQSGKLTLRHVAGGVYDAPKYLGEIPLAEGAKPAWILSGPDRLYLNYFNQPKIDILTPEGTKVKSFVGTLKPKSGSPQGMALIENKLLVADLKNRALLMFNPQGEYLESFAKRPDGQEFIPVGAAVYNRVFYLADVHSKGWMAIGDDGELINVVKGEDEKSALEFPYGLLVTEDGRVIVTDPQLGKIKVFVCTGWYAYDFPTAEVGLQNPQGIARDGLGRIHIVDNGTNQVFVYDEKGYFRFKYGAGLQAPANISIDTKRRVIYITNTGQGNISLWGY